MTTAVERDTFIECTLGGNVLDNVLSARVSFGFDQAVAEASIVLASEPEDGSYNDTVTVALGAGGDDGANNAVCFTGLLKQYERSLFPRSITLVARGNLSRAAEYRPFGQDDARSMAIAGLQGLNLVELVGATAVDEDIVLAVLERVPGLDVNIGLIGGTSTNLGGLPPDATLWGTDETALAYIQRIDAASLGYRTFESFGGTIYRVQIAGWPGANDPDFTFTEGLDIFEAHSTRTILELKNCARVDGYDYGIGANIITFILAGSNDVQGDSTDNPQEVRLSTSLAGRITAAAAGPGFSCEDIATYLLSEWNRELVRVTMVTPLDSIIGPGQTHLITTASGLPDRIHVAEKGWVQHVDRSVDESGLFSQSITYLAGGVGSGADDDGFEAPIDWASA